MGTKMYGNANTKYFFIDPETTKLTANRQVQAFMHMSFA